MSLLSASGHPVRGELAGGSAPSPWPTLLPRYGSSRYRDHDTELVGRVADDVSNGGVVAVWEFDGRADVRGAVERGHHH